MKYISSLIPIKFSEEEREIHFDHLDSTQELNWRSDFKFVEKVTGKEGYSYKISFNGMNSDTKWKTKLGLKLKRVWSRRKSIKYGVPHNIFDEDKSFTMSYEELEDLEIESDEYDELSKFDKRPISACTILPKPLKVGQGLSWYDESNNFVFDCGGTETYANFVKNIKRKSNVVVISHWHFDHYKYLNKLIDDGYVEKVIFPNKMYRSVRVKKLMAKMKRVGIKRINLLGVGNMTINGWDLFSLKGRYKSLNYDSTIAYNDSCKTLLTGDQSYKRIDKTFRLDDVEYLQIPHHGSASPETGLPMKTMTFLTSPLKKAYASHDKDNVYGHAHNDIKKFFGTKFESVTK